MNTTSKRVYGTPEGTPELSRLLAHVRPDAKARIRRPQVAKQPFSRTPAEAARQDGMDLSVTVRRAS